MTWLYVVFAFCFGLWCSTKLTSHRHDWKRTVIVQAASMSTSGGLNVKGLSSEDMVRVLQGTTTVLYECQTPGCAEIKREEMTGLLYHESRPISEKRGEAPWKGK